MSPEKQNGVLHVLSTLAQSGNVWIQFGSLILITAGAVGNWVATWNSANQNRAEIEINRRVAWEGEQRIKAVVFEQIKEIHTWMKEATDEFHQGNVDSASNRKMLAQFKSALDEAETRQRHEIESLEKILQNHTLMLKNQNEMLGTLKNLPP